MSTNSRLAIAAFAIAGSLFTANAALANLVVNTNLGSLGLGSTPLSATTAGGPNNATTYSGASTTALWDQEYVYQFTTTTAGVISLTTNDPNGTPTGAIDNDFFLLNSLSTSLVGGVNTATGVIPSQPASGFSGVETSGTWGPQPAGTYYLVADSFRGAAASPTAQTSGAFTGTLAITSAVATIPTTVATVNVSNTSANYAVADTVVPTTGGGIKWIKVVVSSPITDANNFFLDIDTEGAADAAGASFDTEIGLYRADGSLVANDDDSGSGPTSQLSFGDTVTTGRGPLTTAPATSAGFAGDGFNGDLAAGTYYLAVGGYNTTFGPLFNVTTTNTDTSASVPVNFRTNVAVPEPTMLAAFAGLGLTLVRRSRR